MFCLIVNQYNMVWDIMIAVGIVILIIIQIITKKCKKCRG